MLRPHDFLGDWTVDRAIEDRLGGRAGRFDGAARFEADGAGLRYREEGTLRLGGAAYPARREHLWRWDGGEVAVLFADGRPFHRFRPEGRGPGTDHPCGRDLYRVRYDFAAWPLWTAAWEVSGPAKGYALRAAYARA